MSPTSYLTAPPRGGCQIIAPLRGASKAGKLDRRAAVHDHAQARGAGALRRLVVDHPELHPDRLGADRDRLLDVRGDGGRAAEEVDALDALARRQARPADLAEQARAVRVDRDDAVAAGLQHR